MITSPEMFLESYDSQFYFSFQLLLKKGEMLMDVERVDADWLMGTIQNSGRHGLVP